MPCHGEVLMSGFEDHLLGGLVNECNLMYFVLVWFGLNIEKKNG